MPTPYWGDLPGPNLKASTASAQRSSSDDYSSRHHKPQPMDRETAAPAAAAYAPHSRSNRASVQTDSTLSPYASPRGSFQGQGLAPRPPSQSNYPPDIVEKRRRRASKNKEEADAYSVSGALPAAPDVPKGPPVSFRHPYGNGGLPYTITKPGASEPDVPPSPGGVDPDAYRHSSSERPKRSSINSTRRASSGSTGPTRNGSAPGYRQASLGSEEDRRLFADTRSPLQRLELTLGSMTKEEKRTRLEAAERNARQHASRGADKEGSQTPTVRFKDDDMDLENDSPRTQALAEPLSVTTSRAPQRVGVVHDHQQLTQRQGSHSKKSLGTKAVMAAGAKDNAPPHRNMSFRERAAQEEINLPDGGRDSPATPPTSTPTSGFLLTRTGSNKLKKDPPGDPWFQRRHEAEKKYGQISINQKREVSQAPNQARGPAASAAPESVEPPHRTAGGSVRNKVPPPTTDASSRQARRQQDDGDDLDSLEDAGGPTGRSRNDQRSQFPATNSRQNATSRNKLAGGAVGAAAVSGAAAAAAGRPRNDHDASDAEDRSDDDHHFAQYFHRHEYKPGQGLFNPPKYLNEWKKGTVGTLSGTLLDLSGEMTPITDKGQTWWETPPSQRRGSISARPRKAEAFDGEYDEANGRHLFNNLFYSTRVTGDEDGEASTVGNHRQSWSLHYDDVVPHAREFLGHQATTDGRKARRQTRLYSLGRSSAAQDDGREPSRIAALCSCLPCLSSFTRPKHSYKHTLLTQAPRMVIRVPNYLAPTRFKPPLYLKCGPLLRYCGMRTERSSSKSTRGGPALEREFWRGTVMIVTADAESEYDIAPTLRLFAQPLELLPPPPAEVHGELPTEYVDPVAGHPKLGRKGELLYVRPAYHLSEGRDHSRDDSDEGLFEKTRSPPDFDLPKGATEAPGSFADRKKKSPLDGEKLGKYKDVRGYRLHAERGYTFWRFSVEVELRDKEQRIAYRINRGPATGFWVPAKGQSMNIMFHSCNGFSLSVNPDELSGPDPMWRDVLNSHQSRPFHVMLGGGDQLYCDAVMRQTRHFQDWLMIRNPIHKHNAPFTAEMQDELEAFYLERYCMWFSQGLFGLANSQIPMVNMYDDHDIIDGFGSYPDHFMTSPVFSGLGNVAFKYYMLFQQQSIPSETEETEPSWSLGLQPGPYIHEQSRSLFMFLGSKIALLAVDCRTERKRDQVLREDTWEKLINRCYGEIVKGRTEHLLVLLGVPIAYPRLVWLENILTSRLLDPIKALGKTGLFGNVFNKFDGGVEVLDDLDDHWTAKNHKDERKLVIEDLQDLAADRSVRVTILSGDVHLAAVGQFYSNPKLGLAKHKDFRYMPNVVSSAIVNTPPPDLMADVLNKRNKVHHFDKDTDEDMIPMFAHGVEGKPRNNTRLLPHRNWCAIREYSQGQTPPSSPSGSIYDGHSSAELAGPQGTSFINRGVTRRLSKRNRDPAYRTDVIDSRPPNSTRAPGGLFRTLSSRGRRSDSDVQADGKRPASKKRTLSLTRGDFGLFRRGSKNKQPQTDADDTDGTWDRSDPDVDDYENHGRERSRGNGLMGAIGLRGGGGSNEEFSEGDESYFSARAPENTAATRPVSSKTTRLLGDEAPPPTNGRGTQSQPRGHGYGTTTTVSGPAQQKREENDEQFRPKPFHRTPTSTSMKAARKAQDVNIQGGLDITLNVEVNAKDPTGITVPYRLLVPRLWYDAAEGEEVELPPKASGGGMKRLLSLNRGKSTNGAGKDTSKTQRQAAERSGEWPQPDQQGALLVEGRTRGRSQDNAPGTAF